MSDIQKVPSSCARTRRALGGLSLLFALVGLASDTLAQAPLVPQVELAWSAPDECPDETQAQDALERLMANAQVGRERADVRVHIDREPASYAASIEFSGALRGQRTLSGNDCRSVVDAALLIVAITADPMAALTYVEVADKEAARPQPDRLRADLGVSVAGDLGSLPRASLGAGLHVGLSRARFQAGLDLRWWLPREEWRGPREGTGGEIRLVDGTLRGCFDVLRWSHVGLGPCLGAALGWSSGFGKNLRDNGSAHAPWAAALAGVHVRPRVDRLFVDFGADVGLAFVRPEYVVDAALVFQPALWLGRFSLAVGWSLP